MKLPFRSYGKAKIDKAAKQAFFKEYFAGLEPPKQQSIPTKMSEIISVRINVDKIDKRKIFIGEKGRWLDITIAPRREKGKYGATHTVYHQQTPEEREARDEKVYLGDGRAFKFEEKEATYYDPDAAEEDDLPF